MVLRYMLNSGPWGPHMTPFMTIVCLFVCLFGGGLNARVSEQKKRWRQELHSNGYYLPLSGPSMLLCVVCIHSALASATASYHRFAVKPAAHRTAGRSLFKRLKFASSPALR